MTWAQWKRMHVERLRHPANFEALFVDRVLSHIALIDPEDVVPQYAFVDDAGKRRRIDFMIINPHKGYLLPIELDGASKDPTPGKWVDFLDRQNAVVRSFGTILRYANLKMLNNPDEIIREVSEQLLSQASRMSARAVQIDATHAIAAPPDSAPSPSTRASPAPAGSASAQMRALAAIGMRALLAICALIFGGVGMLVVARHLSSGEPPTVSPGTTGAASSHAAVPVSAANRDRPAPHSIAASEAGAHVGQFRVVCGRLSGIRRISSGMFINFDYPYPDETLSAVIWADHLQTVSPPSFATGAHLCIEGTIKTYRGKPRIEIEKDEQILR